MAIEDKQLENELLEVMATRYPFPLETIKKAYLYYGESIDSLIIALDYSASIGAGYVITTPKEKPIPPDITKLMERKLRNSLSNILRDIFR